MDFAVYQKHPWQDGEQDVQIVSSTADSLLFNANSPLEKIDQKNRNLQALILIMSCFSVVLCLQIMILYHLKMWWGA